METKFKAAMQTLAMVLLPFALAFGLRAMVSRAAVDADTRACAAKWEQIVDVMSGAPVDAISSAGVR